MKKNGSIAILGGMGPQASAKLLEVLFTMCNRDYKAKNDSDFPEVILNSIPVPNFISDKKNINIAQNILLDKIKMLEDFNPICFGMACNTAHIMLNCLQSSTKVPFVSIIEEVTKTVAETKIKKIGLMGTPVTIKSELYQKSFRKNNVQVIIPSKEDCKKIEKVIQKVLTGNSGNKEKQLLKRIAKTLMKNGAQGIILGCTELPLIFPKDFGFPVFDSIEILAKALLKKFFENTISVN